MGYFCIFLKVYIICSLLFCMMFMLYMYLYYWFLSLPTKEMIWNRITSSYQLANTQLSMRTQPTITLYGTTPIDILTINTIYLSTIFLLYKWMKHRSSHFRNALQPVLYLYNLLCIFLAGIVVVGIITYKIAYPDNLKFVCNEPTLTDESAEWIAHVFWLFYAQKYFEFLDTVFFTLRKRFYQISFLHLFHHTSITFVVGFLLPYNYSGDMYLPILLNSIVHVFMYAHYLSTSYGIKAWWRPYLTSMQLIQFAIIAYQSMLAWSNGPTCGAPDFAKAIMIVYMGCMGFLFSGFFIRRYICS